MISAAQRYRELVDDLMAATRRQSAATAGAHSSYAEGIAAVEHDLAAAQEAVNHACAEVTRAQRFVAHTDLLAAALWDELKEVRGRRLGPLPAPADHSNGHRVPRFAQDTRLPSSPDGDTMDAAASLERAAARIERARRGGEALPAHVLPVLFLLGATTAGLLAALAALVAWPLLLAAPLSGLLAARAWVDHRYAARLDPGGIGLVVLGGMLATAAAWLNLR